ncbi:hypothetical protein [Hymenobacter norwichensis]|uniref:hypothetical protein n=1 Tax=Hymenobacter norwichensis TaxID=223903 RepID=UPI0003B5D22E|nr:hypothetical protein [Hymenobacter norwichensis]
MVKRVTYAGGYLARHYSLHGLKQGDAQMYSGRLASYVALVEQPLDFRHFFRSRSVVYLFMPVYCLRTKAFLSVYQIR